LVIAELPPLEAGTESDTAARQAQAGTAGKIWL
jgi:hypothetical protein